MKDLYQKPKSFKENQKKKAERVLKELS